MRRTRTVLLIIAVVSLFVGGSAPFFANMDPTVAQETETPQLAPLNPDFLDYLENPPEPSYGYMPSPVNLSHLSEIPMPRMAALTQPPSAFDWRDEGKVTPVKDQNPCGTCWIFGTIAAIESRVWIVDGAEYDFSEQNVACCTDPSWVYLDGNRCNGGGWSWLATDLLTKKGTRLESCDPYNTGTINTDSCDDACTTIKRITGYRMVANSPSQIDEVKNAIYNYGPVSMAYYHTDDPSRWSGNTYYYPGCTEDADHLVTIVGWDDDVEHPEGGGSGVWIIKNSWGTDWGDDGYFYLCYGSANMQEVASYRYQDYYAGEIIYYWDEAGLVDMGGYGDNSAWMASVFTCEQNGDLTHVDFWTTSNGAQYQLYIYDGSFGSELASQTGTCDELGYYSIPLDTPVSITADQQFTVAVKMTTPGNIYPLPVELRGSQLEPPIYDWVEPPIQSGACFVKHYGWNPWVDAVGFAGVGVNFCLRARILTNTPPEVENVTASQGAGTGIVNISYDVDDVQQSSVDISFQYWDSSGWHDCTTTIGDGSTPTGPGKTGTWDAKADFDGQYRADCKIRVIADDNQPSNNIGTGDSGEFALDTEAPTGYCCSTPPDEATGIPIDPALTSLTASDDSPPILYKFMLAEDSGFSQGVQESDWQTDTSWAPSMLAECTDYWWKVKAGDSYGNEGGWCTPFTFTTRVPDIRTPIGDIDFGDVVVESSLDSTTTIYNDGCGPLTVNSITRTSGSEDFTYIGPAAPFDIGAGGSQDITVRFAPSSSGAKGATFNVNSNDPDEPDVTFTASGTGRNSPPNQPGSPSPADDATGVSIGADLSWTGGDPDGHTVTYDVYFGTSTSPPLVSDDQVATTYDPATMSYDTHYYWKVVATDNHGASTEGPVWGFTTEVDSDGDGVPDIEEQGPDGSDEDYDGNDDGTYDSQQDNVASFHTYNGEHYVTIASPNGTTFVNVQAVDNPSPEDAPAKINFPYGFFEFTVSGVGTGDTPVTLYLPGGRSINAYYKYGQTPGDPTPDPPHWYEFRYDGETGAEISGSKVTLHFVDGKRGDDDLTKDGTIVEPGGPGYRKPAGPSGGGGGGGGAPPRGPELKVNMIGRVASGSITKDGELEETIDVTSRDEKVRLCLDEGTVVLDTEGNCLEEVTVGRVLEPPAVREKWHVIGIAYDFGPDGATFDPSVGLTIFYDPEELPERVNEEDLVIAYYHTDSEEWRLLEPSAVDTGAHTVTAPVCHCTHYAIIGREEAVFDFANLSISPSLVDHGDSVTITVEATNSGGMEGSCTVTLLIDGAEEASYELTLGPRASDTGTFAVMREDAGTYEATIDGLSGSFTVTADQFPWWAVGLGTGVFLLVVAAVVAYLVIWRSRRATA